MTRVIATSMKELVVLMIAMIFLGSIIGILVAVNFLFPEPGTDFTVWADDQYCPLKENEYAIFQHDKGSLLVMRLPSTLLMRPASELVDFREIEEDGR